MVDRYTYLGHILSSDGSDDCDIQRQHGRVYAQGNSILQKFHMCSTEVKIVLFKSYCTSLYTAHLWSNYIKLFIGLSKWEHKWPICVGHDIPYGLVLMKNYPCKFICRLDESPNIIIKAITNSDCKYNSPLRKRWRNL